MTNPDDEKITNEEYEPIETLDQIDGKDGEPLDPIEQNQSEEDYAAEGGSKEELHAGITGDVDAKDDE
jgi:hypothetical protein